ncbi:MAG: hypothetical protein SNJ71_03550, partial [Bacteroidales bacterium]
FALHALKFKNIQKWYIRAASIPPFCWYIRNNCGYEQDTQKCRFTFRQWRNILRIGLGDGAP